LLGSKLCPSSLTLAMTCTPCTASRSHAAWDVVSCTRKARAISGTVWRESRLARAGILQRASAARLGLSRLILDGIVEVGEVTKIILGMTASPAAPPMRIRSDRLGTM
jgi:hypothetical protein